MRKHRTPFDSHTGWHTDRREGPTGRPHRRGFAAGPRFGPGGWHGFGHRHGGRMRRGGTQAAILALLAEEPMHGYQIIQELATRSAGAWTPGAGSVYPALEQMEAQALITGEDQDAKRVYSLTDKGREVAERQKTMGNAPWTDAAEAFGPRVGLFGSMKSLIHAVQQVGKTGTDEQVARAAELMDQTRKQIYSILAE